MQPLLEKIKEKQLAQKLLQEKEKLNLSEYLTLAYDFSKYFKSFQDQFPELIDEFWGTLSKTDRGIIVFLTKTIQKKKFFSEEEIDLLQSGVYRFLTEVLPYLIRTTDPLFSFLFSKITQKIPFFKK